MLLLPLLAVMLAVTILLNVHWLLWVYVTVLIIGFWTDIWAKPLGKRWERQQLEHPRQQEKWGQRIRERPHAPSQENPYPVRYCVVDQTWGPGRHPQRCLLLISQTRDTTGENTYTIMQRERIHLNDEKGAQRHRDILQQKAAKWEEKMQEKFSQAQQQKISDMLREGATMESQPTHPDEQPSRHAIPLEQQLFGPRSSTVDPS